MWCLYYPFTDKLAMQNFRYETQQFKMEQNGVLLWSCHLLPAEAHTGFAAMIEPTGPHCCPSRTCTVSAHHM